MFFFHDLVHIQRVSIAKPSKSQAAQDESAQDAAPRPVQAIILKARLPVLPTSTSEAPRVVALSVDASTTFESVASKLASKFNGYNSGSVATAVEKDGMYLAYRDGEHEILIADEEDVSTFTLFS
jgi:hypothetical protein